MKHQENILVIPTADVPVAHKHNALNEIHSMQDLLKNAQYLPRYLMEEDSNYKQIIPYVLVLNRKGQVLTYQRSTKSGEERLHAKYSIGVGGHIDEVDGESPVDAFHNGLQRELLEELGIIAPSFEVAATISITGTPVDNVHLGVVCAIMVDNEDFLGELDVLVNREFLGFSGLGEKYSQLEAWSQIVYDCYGKLLLSDSNKLELEALREDLKHD